MIDSQSIADTLSALAHPTRVDIFKCLLAHYPKGLKAATLSAEAALAPSTLSHHLREMEKGGVIVRHTQGQSTITSLDLKSLTRITADLMQICCSVEETSNDGSPS